MTISETATKDCTANCEPQSNGREAEVQTKLYFVSERRNEGHDFYFRENQKNYGQIAIHRNVCVVYDLFVNCD